MLELSRQKAEEVAGGILSYLEHGLPSQLMGETKGQDILVIGADTVVTYADRILGKPKDEQDAEKTAWELCTLEAPRKAERRDK